MEFRANFMAQAAMGILWFSFILMIVVVIFRSTSSIAGWNEAGVLALSCVCYGVGSLYNSFCWSLVDFSSQVRLGSLDFILLKPVDPQFWASFRRFNLAQTGPLVATCVMLPVSLRMGGLHPSGLQWLGFAVTFVSAVITYYGFNLIIMTMAVWLVRVDNLSIVSDTMWQIGRNPMQIFPKSVQFFFLYLLPIAIFGSVPAEQLVFKFSASMTVLAAVWGVFMLYGSRLFWRYGLSQYSSASS